MIATDATIRKAVKDGHIEIDPFAEEQLNPASYDLRLGNLVLTYAFPAGRRHVHDVKEEPPCYRPESIGESGIVILPETGYLMHTVERVKTSGLFVPVLDGKSSVGRLFVSVHQTAGYGDPGFDGQYTLEVTTLYPIRLYAGMRIAQMRFHATVGEVEKPYAGNYVGEAARGPVPSAAWRQFR